MDMSEYMTTGDDIQDATEASKEVGDDKEESWTWFLLLSDL